MVLTVLTVLTVLMGLTILRRQFKVIFLRIAVPEGAPGLEDSSAASATSSEFRQAEAEKKALEELMDKVPVTDFGEPTSLGSM